MRVWITVLAVLGFVFAASSAVIEINQVSRFRRDVAARSAAVESALRRGPLVVETQQHSNMVAFGMKGLALALTGNSSRQTVAIVLAVTSGACGLAATLLAIWG